MPDPRVAWLKGFRALNPIRHSLGRWGMLGLLGVGLVAAFILHLTMGSVAIPAVEVVAILTGEASSQPVWEAIVWELRLPRGLTAVLAGAALSVSGLQMQTLFRNPLVGPAILGISAGASLGVALVVFGSGGVVIGTLTAWGLGGSGLVVLAATCGAAGVLLLVLAMALRVRDNVALLLVGIMVSHLTVALVSLWQYFSHPERIREFLVWTFGSLGRVTGEQLVLLTGVVGAGMVLSLGLSKPLNLMLLGEHYARSLGIRIVPARLGIILATSLLAGSVTAFCGPIGFVGIAVPHLARGLIQTSDHRWLTPGAGLLGALLLLLCDTVAQLPGSPMALPINAVTALVGAPVVLGLILRRRRWRWG